MALYKDDYYPNYSEEIFDGYDIKKFWCLCPGRRRLACENMLVDETDGRFRYFIIDTGFWVFGKKIVLVFSHLWR